MKNEIFLRYVFEETDKQLEYWRLFMAQNPSQKDDILQAKDILLHLDDYSDTFSLNELESLRKRIKKSLEEQKLNRKH